MTSPKTDSLLRRDLIGWSMYDFANTIYSMNIVSLYLKLYMVEDLGYADYWYDIPFALSMALAAALLPGIGAMSDHSTKKKIFLFLFTVSCCIAVGGMAFVTSYSIWFLVILFIFANFSYEACQPFYNALLYSVTDGRQARFVSGLGVAFGYVGSIVGMAIVLPFVTGSLFALEIPFLEAGGKTAAFIPTALLFFIFSLPLFFWVKEREPKKVSKISLRESYLEIWETLKLSRKYPGVLRFLIADYFVEDAAATVILNIGIYCSLVLGFSSEKINLFLMVSTVSAVAGSFIIGFIARKRKLKSILNVIIIGWILSLLLFVFVENNIMVWILGSVVGILLGGLWTTTRPLLAEMVPKDELGKFFGIFALSGRAAAIVGPLIWTAIVYFFQVDRTAGKATLKWLALDNEGSAHLPYQVALFSLAVMMMIGLYILRKVPDTNAE